MHSPLGNWAFLMPQIRKYPLPSATGQRPYPLAAVPRLRLWEFDQLNPGLAPVLPPKERVKYLERTEYLKDRDHNDLILSRYYPLYINPWTAVDTINSELRENPEIVQVSLNPTGWTFYMSKFANTGVHLYAYRRSDQPIPSAGTTCISRKRRRSRGPLITYWRESGGLVKSEGSREWAYEKPICMIKLQDFIWGLGLHWDNGELKLGLSDRYA